MECVGAIEVDPRSILTPGGIQGTWDDSSEYIKMTEENEDLMDRLADEEDAADAEAGEDGVFEEDPSSDSE